VSLRRGQLRALHGIDHELADSDPDLDALFQWFTSHTRRHEMPQTEKVGARPRQMLARLRRRRPLAERMKDWIAQNWNDP
jgi:aminoglycoside phosphotransferase (APT) family kinase protein